MQMTFRLFTKQYKITPDLLKALIKQGKIPAIIKDNTTYLDTEALNSLLSGVDLVECPFCGEKKRCITAKHYKKCSPDKSGLSPMYSDYFLKNKAHTAEQKKHQSETLKRRFKTAEGEITRKQISIASKNLNSDPEFIKKKRLISKEVQNRPEHKKKCSEQSLRMWADPVFRKKMDQYKKDNLKELQQSAINARKHLKKQSNLHLAYKKMMLQHNIEGFLSEYSFGPYSLDEADPLAKVAVEIDGCYWHGCNLCGYPGDTRIKKMDARRNSYLINRGWAILRIPEHALKKDPKYLLSEIKKMQLERRILHKSKIKQSFETRQLQVRSLIKGSELPVWNPLSDILKHYTPNTRILEITTNIGSVGVTEDHSLFRWDSKTPAPAGDLHVGDAIVGAPWDRFEPLTILEIKEQEPEEFTYDVSVPGSQNALLDSGILVHNSYSISGVSLDIEKSSKYQAMQEEFLQTYEKLADAAKASIKIIKGLRQQKFGVGISSALGPLSRPGVQSRRNFVSGGGGGWS